MHEHISYVTMHLKLRKKQFDLISERTGVSRKTLYRTMNETTTPSIDTLMRLYNFFKKNARKKILE